MSLNLNQIFTGLIVALFLGMAGYIIYLQHQVNKEIKAKIDQKFNQIEVTLNRIDTSYSALNVKIRNLKFQNDSIKTLQKQSYEINQQAKEQADRAISAYRDLIFSLPEY